jgi:hypothetical protein
MQSPPLGAETRLSASLNYQIGVPIYRQYSAARTAAEDHGQNKNRNFCHFDFLVGAPVPAGKLIRVAERAYPLGRDRCYSEAIRNQLVSVALGRASSTVSAENPQL